MKSEMKLNTIVWVVLVLLIMVSTIFSANKLESAYLLITAFAVFKFLIVIFQFVEVKHAHPLWKALSVLFVLIYFLTVIVLY